ncbi:MAG: transglutaminase family protein [Melioribacteraceae bacterium]|nr:transglutaminase family protein [Melioribacteraceae bacterium]
MAESKVMDREKLKYLVKLIDDESEEVRNNVLFELYHYGPNLEIDLLEFSGSLSKSNRKLLEPIINSNRKNWLRDQWIKKDAIKDDFQKLEYCLNLISKFQLGLTVSFEVTSMLDKLAMDFRNYYPYGNEVDLSVYLFQQLGIEGASKDYYNPMNSNAVYAIRKRKGLPITLALIYILVGKRCGFHIEGCNFPGHFLARIKIDNELVLVDCFNGGRLIYKSNIAEFAEDMYDSVMFLIEQEANINLIIKRVLANLINAYSKSKQPENAELFQEFLLV